MTPGRYWTIFEHGYVISDNDRSRVEHAIALPDTLFQWLVQRCLSDNAEYDGRLLTLRSVGRVQALQVKNYVGVIALPGGAFIEVLPKTAMTTHENS